MPCLTLLYPALFIIIPFTNAFIPSAGDCGTASVPNVPGCFGQPGCCDGVVVPLLPEVVYGSTTIGCASYTTQPSADECPTSPATIPPPSGAAVVTGTISGITLTETFAPTIYTQFATLKTTITTTMTGASSEPTTVTVGPSGVAWIPFNPNDTLPYLPVPLSIPFYPIQAPSSGLTTVTTVIGSESSSVSLTSLSASSSSGIETVITDGSTVIVHSASAVALTSRLSGVVVIDSSTLLPPPTTQTITRADGSTVIIGPSGVMIEGSVISFQNTPTTITTDGITLTFGVDSTLSTISSMKSNKLTSIPTSDPSATGTPAITPPPSGGSGALPDVLPTSHPTNSAVAITLDGETYVLPYTISIELLQSNGEVITLFPDAIVSGGATATITSLSAQTYLSVGGVFVEAGPSTHSSHTGGGVEGFDGLIDALKSLGGSANSIVNTLDQIGQQAVLWSGDSLSNSEFASSVGGLFDAATSGLSDFASTMNSVMVDFNAETYELTDDGIRRVFEARVGAVEEFDLLGSLRKLLRGITGLRNDVILTAKAYWVQGTAAAAVLAAAEESLRNFGAYDWDSEKRSHTSSTSSTTISSTITVSTPDSSSSSSSSSTTMPTPYYFVTKPGTKLTTFNSFIKSLPDQGNGYQITFPDVPWQGYMTNFTETQAEEVRNNDFIHFVSLVTEYNSTEAAIIPSKREKQKRLFGRSDLTERKNSYQHLRLLSVADQISIIGDSLPEYLADPKLGKGQTIYILDSGFNTAHRDFTTGRRGTISTMVVPNRLTLAMESDTTSWAAEDISDISGHGTAVASVAGGAKHGVASRANLVLVKLRNSARNPHNPTSTNMVPRGVTGPALLFAWTWTIQDIKNRREKGDKGKFIINMSLGFRDLPNVPGVEDGENDARTIMTQVLEECWANDIITVVAAGNEGENGRSLDEASPQFYGTRDNGLITVGGVNAKGALSIQTTFDAGKGGSITVYALAESVDVATHTDNSGSLQRGGTSFAAPAVAGLAAYFASLPSLDARWIEGQVAVQMKRYISEYAYVRSADPIPQMGSTAQYAFPQPDTIKVAYNRAPENLCAKKAPSKRSLSLIPVPDPYTGDLDVVDDGILLFPGIIDSYCPLQSSSSIRTTTLQSATTEAITTSFSAFSLTNLPTLASASYCTEILSNGDAVYHTQTAASCTYNTVVPFTSTTKNASPTATEVAIDQGLLYCGTRTDQDNAQYWFTPGDASAAINQFCSNLTNSDPPLVFEPGSHANRSGAWIQPDNVASTVMVFAQWNSVDDSGCPTWDFSQNEDGAAYKQCQERLSHPLDDCKCPVRPIPYHSSADMSQAIRSRTAKNSGSKEVASIKIVSVGQSTQTIPLWAKTGRDY
ncbi:hypothetical protein K431DRAFT_346376 [Polychaeton citri CBS 116435]|uniref:Peptidase S8/S53 domain-containing protein n=1 Tax=Polychaeton citri CBS 116435 TaxID=1314669 RepID=A0A9P4Q6I4_9PEZI|nr:hypothetical protein K431DRAFT_346376 [Polychaeton citri CBS 116435]